MVIAVPTVTRSSVRIEKGRSVWISICSFLPLQLAGKNAVEPTRGETPKGVLAIFLAEYVVFAL